MITLITITLAVAYQASAQAVVTSRSSQYFIQNHNAFVAPYVAQYIASPVALTLAPASYIVAPAPGVVATPPAAQQPVPSPNPDAETVEVESAKVRSLKPVERVTQQQQPIRAAQQPIRALNLRLLPVTQPQPNAKVQATGQRTNPGVVNGQRFLFA